MARAQVGLICTQQHDRKPNHPSYFANLKGQNPCTNVNPESFFFFGQIQPGVDMSKLLCIGPNRRSAQAKEIQSGDTSGPRDFHFFFKTDNLRKAAPV